MSQPVKGQQERQGVFQGRHWKRLVMLRVVHEVRMDGQFQASVEPSRFLVIPFPCFVDALLPERHLVMNTATDDIYPFLSFGEGLSGPH